MTNTAAKEATIVKHIGGNGEVSWEVMGDNVPDYFLTYRFRTAEEAQDSADFYNEEDVQT